MLEDSLFESLGRTKTRKPVTVLVSGVLHVALVSVLTLIPLAQTQAVPVLPTAPLVFAPQPKTPKTPDLPAPAPQIQRHIIPDSDAVIAPHTIPRDIAYVVDAPESATGLLVPVRHQGSGTVLALLTPHEAEPAVLLPPPPPPPPVVNIAPIRVGGKAQLANLIYRVQPNYPPLARQARVQGVVQLEAIVTKEGTIDNLRVISGHPLLNQAALDAVKQWRYKPTLLNGEPVEVITTITVTFALQ